MLPNHFDQKNWKEVGLTVHIVNGMAIGALIPLAARHFGISVLRSSLTIITAEHLATFPLTFFTDRYHPAREDGDVGPVFNNPNAFAQATYRHLLFGVIAGLLGRRIA